MGNFIEESLLYLVLITRIKNPVLIPTRFEVIPVGIDKSVKNIIHITQNIDFGRF